MKIKTAAIVGAGSLGILLGKPLNDFLGRDSVTFIADPERCLRYTREGVYSNGQRCDFSYSPEPRNGPVDLLVFALKSYALEDTLPMARSFVGKDTIIMSLMNGITSEEIIGEALGKEKVIYTVAMGMDAAKNGNMHISAKPGEYWIGESDGTVSERLLAVASLFEEAGIVCRIQPDIRYRLWSKLMLNTGVNQTLAVLGGDYRYIHENIRNARTIMRDAMEEVRAVAACEGIDIAEEDIDRWFTVIDGLGADKKPSMVQDVEAGRRTEVELFAGTIRKLGMKHGIPTPVNDWLYRELGKNR